MRILRITLQENLPKKLLIRVNDVCFQFGSKIATGLVTQMIRGRVFQSLALKILNCLKTIHSIFFKRFEEITSGCLSGSNFVSSNIWKEIVVEVRRGYLVDCLINESQDI